MNQHISVVTALLNSIAYNGDDLRATVVPEADFVPFDFSHLRDFLRSKDTVKMPRMLFPRKCHSNASKLRLASPQTAI
jgi:hypothetical protein